jgi:hypothetical protein
VTKTEGLPVRWLAAGGLAATLVAAIAVGTTLSGGSGDPTDVAAANTVDQSLTGASAPAVDSDPAPRDVTGLTTDSAADPATGTPAPRVNSALATPVPTPITWQQQVAAHPDEPIRLNPLASDWTVEQLIIGKDLAGKFIGRVNVRYSGPGSATGAFEVVLLKDGTEIARLVGETAGEVRAGVYPVILSTGASYADGPWTTQFRVVSTS